MPAIVTMIEVPSTIADLGLARAGDREAAPRALATAKRIHRRSKHSFYAATALRLQAQAEQLLADDGWRRTLDRASAHPMSEVDRLAIAALTDATPPAGKLASAVAWNTAGAVGR